MMNTVSILAASSGIAMSGEGVYNYGLVIVLMMTGLYLVLSKGNMIKSIIGLNLFQVSVIMFYVSMGKIEGGTAPILMPEDQGHHEEAEAHGSVFGEKERILAVTSGDASAGKVDAGKDKHEEELHIPEGAATIYSNPLPHVLMLTAIVVGVATTALALSLVVRINEYYGTIEEDLLEEVSQ